MILTVSHKYNYYDQCQNLSLYLSNELQHQRAKLIAVALLFNLLLLLILLKIIELIFLITIIFNISDTHLITTEPYTKKISKNSIGSNCPGISGTVPDF